MSINKKTVLVTGCSEGGIGASLALAYHQTKKYHVFATARNTSKIPQPLSSLPDVTVLSLDVTSKPSLEAAVKAVSTATSGRLDVLVNNSGSGLVASGLDSDIDAAKAVFEVNFFGLLATIQHFTPLLIKAKGTIVNNSSIAGEITDMYNGIYAASKAAVTQQSEVMRLEMAPLGVRVVTIATGVVKTKFFEKQQAPDVPEGSYYSALAGFLRDRAAGKDISKDGVDVDEYAGKVVRLVEGGATGKIYVGGLSFVFKWVVWWMPTRIMDRIVLDRNKLPPAPGI